MINSFSWICTEGCGPAAWFLLIFGLILQYILPILVFIFIFYLVKLYRSKDPNERKNATLITKGILLLLLVIIVINAISGLINDYTTKRRIDSRSFTVYGMSPNKIDATDLSRKESQPANVKTSYVSSLGITTILQVKIDSNIVSALNPPNCNIDYLSWYIKGGSGEKTENDTCTKKYEQDGLVLYRDDSRKHISATADYIAIKGDTVLAFFNFLSVRPLDGSEQDVDQIIIEFLTKSEPIPREQWEL